MKKRVMLLLIIMSFAASWSYASGLAIPEQGAAALGMSAAMTARSEDLSAIYYNPAGLDYVKKFEVYLGMTPIRPYHEFNGYRYTGDKNPTKANRKTYLPPQIYAAYRASKSVVLGLGVFSPFGLGTDWNKTWPGRYTSTFSEITTLYINPSVAIQANPNVSVGFGLSYITSDMVIEKMVDTGGMINPALAAKTQYDSQFKLDGSGSGFGYNIGVMLRPEEKFQVGVSYRSAYDIKYEGKAKFTHKEQNIKTAVADDALMGGASAAVASARADTAYSGVSSMMPASQDGDATLHMPWMLNIGFKYDVNDAWDYSFEFDMVGWEVYDKLVIDFDKNKPNDKLVQPKDWENSYVFRFGTSYDFTKFLTGRLGLMYDWDPVPDKTIDGQLPDSNRIGFSVGLGYTIAMVRIDASYMRLRFSPRDKENGVGWNTDVTGDYLIDQFDVPPGYPVGNGVYESHANLFSISARYAF